MGVIVADVSVVNVPCCEVQKAGEAAPGQCLPNGVVCENRDDYIFFDNFHPTEISYTYTASRAYRAVLQTDASPVDIERLVRLWLRILLILFASVDNSSITELFSPNIFKLFLAYFVWLSDE